MHPCLIRYGLNKIGARSAGIRFEIFTYNHYSKKNIYVQSITRKKVVRTKEKGPIRNSSAKVKKIAAK